MSEYIHKFDTTSNFESAYWGGSYKEPGVSLVTANNQINYNRDIFNGHEYVDLGLPSGTLWATTNIGASSEYELGDGYYGADTNVMTQYSSVPYYDANTDSYTKYNGTDLKTTLDLSDDAARQNGGGLWKIPTKTEMDELVTNTTLSNVMVNGSRCVKLQSNTSDSFIILPAENNTTVRLGTSTLAPEIIEYDPETSPEDYPEYSQEDFPLYGCSNVYILRSDYFSGNIYNVSTDSYGRSDGYGIRPVIVPPTNS